MAWWMKLNAPVAPPPPPTVAPVGATTSSSQYDPYKASAIALSKEVGDLNYKITQYKDEIKTDRDKIRARDATIDTDKGIIKQDEYTITDICGQLLVDEATIRRDNTTIALQSQHITELSDQLIIDNNVTTSVLTNLYNGIIEQNQAMHDTIYSLDTGNVDREKTYYQNQQIYNLAYYNKYLLYLYFIVVIFVVYLIYKKEWNTYLKLALGLAFVAYPFYIGQLENAIVVFGKYIYSILNANVYTPNN